MKKNHTAGKATPLNRRNSLAALVAAALLAPPLANAQTWDNAGTGNWFTAGNWTAPAAVPVAGGAVTVSNGGTATLAGVAATPVLGSLSIGISDSGTGVGTVTSNGVNMLVGAGGSASVGSSFGAGTSASGVLQITGGAGGAAGNAFVGTITNNTRATTVTGRLEADGNFTFSNGFVVAGQVFSSARGSVANGTINIGGNAGTASFLTVGEVFPVNTGNVGSRSTGVANIGGDLSVTQFVQVGTAFADRVANLAVPGTFHFDQASGNARIGGTLSIANGAGGLSVGATGGGVVSGSLAVNNVSVAPGANLSLTVGRANTGGQATGSVNIGSGDMRVGFVEVGTATNGSARGTVTLGGQLLGNNGFLNVGSLNTGGVLLAQADGSLNAAGGISGFGFYNVGNISGDQIAGSSARGTVVGGAGAPASNSTGILVGSISNSNATGLTANGELTSGNTINVNNGTFTVGSTFGSGRGAQTTGAVNIGGNAGSAQFLVVGDVFNFTPNDVGNRANAAVTIGGNLTVTTLANIGTAFSERVADASVAGGFRFDQTSGSATIGTLSFAPGAGFLNVGTTGGGVATGALSANTLNMAPGSVIGLSVGNAGTGGQANGSVDIGSGDMRVTSAIVGRATNGSAQGSVTLGGQLMGNGGGSLEVGTLNGGGTLLAQAQGNLNAAGGLSGFAFYGVGSLLNAQANGSSARGTVVGGAGAPASSTGSVFVGSIFGGGTGLSANGELTLGNTLSITNGTFAVGQTFGAGRGAQANGTANIAGNAGSVQFLVSGEVFPFTPDDVGSRASGVINIGGNVAVTSITNVGSAFSNRVADAGAPGGFRFDQASGTLTVGGTYTVAAANTFISVGSTGGGVVDGLMRVNNMAMGGNTLSGVTVGLATSNGGTATGALEINGGLMRVDSLIVGVAGSGGTANGQLALTNANLAANNVTAGTGNGGTAQMLFTNSQSTVAQDMALIAGLLRMEKSRLTVGNNLTLGNNTLTHIEIDGVLRGTQYGAIDALAAALDGNIEFDFGDLVFGGASAVFDILRSGSANGINGDFDGFTFLNLLSGYSASAGIELDGGIEIYRVRLTRNDVPEPGSVLLVLLGVGLLLCSRRRLR